MKSRRNKASSMHKMKIVSIKTKWKSLYVAYILCSFASFFLFRREREAAAIPIAQMITLIVKMYDYKVKRF